MKMINQVVGENLKKIRELSGFTQEEVAKSIAAEGSPTCNAPLRAGKGWLYEGGIREIPYHVLENVSNLFGCEAFVLFEDSIHADNEIMATAFRISDLEENDLKEIAIFKDIVMSYLKMERIAQHEAE